MRFDFFRYVHPVHGGGFVRFETLHFEVRLEIGKKLIAELILRLRVIGLEEEDIKRLLACSDEPVEGPLDQLVSPSVERCERAIGLARLLDDLEQVFPEIANQKQWLVSIDPLSETRPLDVLCEPDLSGIEAISDLLSTYPRPLL